MTENLRDTLSSSLQTAEITNDFEPWKLVATTPVGGACALGFDCNAEILLVASSNGQSVFDCTSGECVYRNHDEDGYDPLTLKGHRLDDLSAAPFQMSGLYGGGLLTATSDGWHIDTLQLDWPRTFCILQPPNASIYFLQEKWREYKKDASYHVVNSALGSPVAFGFSWSGKTLVWCDQSDLRVWTRPTHER
jgi:hypothetical protein